MQYEKVQDLAETQLMLDAVRHELRGALQALPIERWKAMHDSACTEAGEPVARMADTALGAARLSFIACANPWTLTLLLDELDRLRGQSRGMDVHARGWERNDH